MKSQNHEIGDLKMRKAVGIILIRKDGFVWTGKRKLGPGVRSGERNLWQMPQGGIDENENPEKAVWREMMEEIGTNNADLFKISNQWVKYDIPQETLDKLPWGKTYIGQMQKWFIFKFSGQENDINVETENPEFSEWKWIKASKLIENAVPFKRIVYKTILDEFSDIF